jgi:hypothetical protein
MLLKRTGIADRISILPACRAVRYSKAILARFCDELLSAPGIIWACFPSKHDNCSVEHERNRGVGAWHRGLTTLMQTKLERQGGA